MLKSQVTDIFFDLDHTLWDFELNSELTYTQIFSDYGIDLPMSTFLEVYVPLNMKYWKWYRDGQIDKETLRYKRLKDVFDQLNHAVNDDLIHHLSEAYIDVLGTQTHLMPFAREILEYLRGNYRLHIITNGFEQVQYRKLQNTGIDHFFQEVIPSERAGVQKPHPDIFKMALGAAKVSANRALMIGDSLEADVLGAISSGMHAIHFNVHNDPPHQHCLIIEHLKEIKQQL